MTRNWWADRLAAPAPSYTPPPPQQPQERPGAAPGAIFRPAAPPRPSQVESASEACPECGSGNYVAPPGTSRSRCFDCGYPIQQSGSGVGSTKVDSPAKKAKQVDGGGFFPGTIVGRVE